MIAIAARNQSGENSRLTVPAVGGELERILEEADDEGEEGDGEEQPAGRRELVGDAQEGEPGAEEQAGDAPARLRLEGVLAGEDGVGLGGVAVEEALQVARVEAGGVLAEEAAGALDARAARARLLPPSLRRALRDIRRSPSPLAAGLAGLPVLPLLGAAEAAGGAPSRAARRRSSARRRSPGRGARGRGPGSRGGRRAGSSSLPP